MIIDTPDARGSTPGGRMGFLDALRGVAVALVVAQHIAQETSSTFRDLSTSYLQLGQMGVMVFFLCSGFIIPATLERNDSLTTFWISRFFRLYPLYWLSLAAAAALTVAGRTVQPGLRVGDWVANATMVQAFLGSPDAIGIYWSLAFEMVFYALASLLFLLGLHRRSVLLSLLSSAGAVAVVVVCELALDHPAPLGVFCLVTMFTGTVVYRLSVGTVGSRTAALCVVVALGVGLLVLWTALSGNSDPRELGARSLLPMASAWLGAYLVFGAGVWRRWALRPLRHLGTISYSVYLMQGIVFVALPAVGQPLLTAAMWTGAILAVSTVTYLLVERPAVAAGRRRVASLLAARSTAGLPAPTAA